MLRILSYVGRNLLRRHPAAVAQVCSAHNSTDNEPVKFTTSRASQWKAAYSRSGNQKEDDDMPWFQPYVVLVSFASFLLYFCVFREENDIDEMLGTTLYDRIEGLEEAQLRLVLRYNLDHGKDTADIVKRIRELEKMRGKVEDS